VYIAVFTPTPRAKQTIAARAKPGFLERIRTAWRNSVIFR